MPQAELAVIIEAKNLARSKDLEALLGESLAAIGEVVHGANRSIGKHQLQGESIRARFGVSSTYKVQICDGASDQEA